MTDRLKGLIVVFNKEKREDDAQLWISAIRMMRDVVDVREVVDNPADAIDRQRVKMDLVERLWKALE